MPTEIKTKKSFGTAAINHFSPAKEAEWPKATGVTLSFEEASGAHLGLGQAASGGARGQERETPSTRKGVGPGIASSGWLLYCRWARYSVNRRKCFRWPAGTALLGGLLDDHGIAKMGTMG